MGGVLARADQWRDFEKKFTALQKQYGFRIWHTKKFRRKSGDFKGWADEKCHDLYWGMSKAASYGLTDVLSLTLDNSVYEANYKSGDWPRKARVDTKYGLCFRYSLVHFVQEVLKRKRKNRIPPLHIVLEAGHANCGEAGQIFLDEKRRYDRVGIPILQTLTVADKDSCGQLMLADFAAYTEFLMEKRELDTGVPRNRSWEDAPRGMTPSTHIQFTSQMLSNLRSELIERHTPKKGPNAPTSIAASKEQPS